MDRGSGLGARLGSVLARSWWRGDASPRWLPALLSPLAWLYGLLFRARHHGYRIGLLRRQRAPVPVIVVGNLIVGGAGKTPTVIALVQALRAAGRVPGVVSRGHGRRDRSVRPVNDDSTAADAGDEPLLIRLRTRAPVWVGRSRVDAARALCAAHPEVDVLIADDGLQHLALERDLQVIVFDERGVGNGRMLPAGPLRQPLPDSLPPATLVLYNAERPTTVLPGRCARRRFAGAVPLVGWWRGASPDPAALRALRGRPVVAIAGVAAPERFFAMLRAEGLLVDPRPLPDHHDLHPLPWAAGEGELLVTEKDAVKLDPRMPDASRVWVVTLDFRLPLEFLDDLLRSPALRNAP